MSAFATAAGDFGMERVFDEGIGRLRRDEKESQMIKSFEERFPWFLGLALALFGIEALLKEKVSSRQAPGT